MARARETTPWKPGFCVILEEVRLPNPYTGRLLTTTSLKRATELGANFVFSCMAVDEIILKMVTKA